MRRVKAYEPRCPRCGGFIPNFEHRGEYPGALSRTDSMTEICSDCGTQEALEDFAGRLTPRSEWTWLNVEFQQDLIEMQRAERGR